MMSTAQVEPIAICPLATFAPETLWRPGFMLEGIDLPCYADEDARDKEALFMKRPLETAENR